MRGHFVPPRIVKKKPVAGRNNGAVVGTPIYEDSERAAEKLPAKDAEASIETEISDLTWAVLDGRATSEQRKRLADLVSLQHQRRETPG